MLATRFGGAAVDLVAEGQFGKMVALRADSIVAVDVASAIGQLKTVRPDGELVRTARTIGIGFGDQSRPRDVARYVSASSLGTVGDRDLAINVSTM